MFCSPEIGLRRRPQESRRLSLPSAPQQLRTGVTDGVFEFVKKQFGESTARRVSLCGASGMGSLVGDADKLRYGSVW